MFVRALLLPLLLAAAVTVGDTQESTQPASSLFDKVFPTFTPSANKAGAVLFGPTIINVETAIAVRYALILATFFYDMLAACDPVALSFFGVKDPIPPAFCRERSDASGKIYAHGILRMLKGEFPQEAALWGDFMKEIGLDPTDETRDQSTPVGWANTIADRHAEYFARDGLNSLGDDTRTNYRQNFADSSGYMPQNPAHLPPDHLYKPLRWQPLTGPADGHGRFATQVHVVPHIGSKIKPLLLSEEEFVTRTVPSPYESPNSENEMSRSDRGTMEKLIDELFETSATLTASRVFLAKFWDNKFASVGFFPGFFSEALNLTLFEEAQNGLGEMIAQWSAIELAWKEKVRHDLVRPTTVIRRLRGGQDVTAYINESVGAGSVSASEWEPIIPIQPHSEYPSASAVLCTASLEHTEFFMRRKVGPNGTIPSFSLNVTSSLAVFRVPEPVQVKFATLAEAAESCGTSRLWAGVHFSPSVGAGNALGSGVGKLAFDHVTDLISGRVPEVCARCMK